jgi:amino acid adenylation domain-containing protein
MNSTSDLIYSWIISKDTIDLVSDLLQYFLDACLSFSASHIPKISDLPSSLSSRLLNLELQRPESMIPESSPQRNESETWTDTEMLIRSVLSKLSGTNESFIRRHTTIYHLGLDSISAVQIASQLKKGGLRVTASDIITYNTCEKLAGFVTCEGSLNQEPQATYDLAAFQRMIQPYLSDCGISMESVEQILPCTALQESMLAQSIRTSGNDYFNFVDFLLDDGLEYATLEKAWHTTINAHPILRTGFVAVQANQSSFSMIQYKPEFKVNRVHHLEGRQLMVFNLEKWRLDTIKQTHSRLQYPPWQVVICNHGNEKSTMHLAIHHALYDAQSLHWLLQDLARACNNKSAILPTLTANSVLDILRQGNIEEGSDRELYWKSWEGNITINKFPILTPLKEQDRLMLVEASSSHISLQEAEKHLKSCGITMQSALQATWTRILSTYLGDSTVIFGVVLSGRTSEFTKDALFPCITTLPVIAENKSSNKELLDDMLKSSAELYRQQHVPLTKIQRLLGCPETRLFDTLLVYQRFDNSSEDQPRPWKVINDKAAIDIPLSIEVEPQLAIDKLEYRITFASDTVPKKHARLLLKQFDLVFYNLVTQPDGHHEDVISYNPELFSISPADQPVLPTDEQLLHQLVEVQARRTPHKTALHFVSGFHGEEPVGRSWSYQELDENGNRVANLLLPLTKPENIVAVCFDKCPEAYFSILGIFKAGCVFLSLDPDSPTSRKEFIIRDAKAVVLLVSEGTRSTISTDIDIPVLIITEDIIMAQSSDPVDVLNSPSSVCYCLYTSGTTGTPKGCLITHDNAVQGILAFQVLFTSRWNPDTSRWLQFASFHFDVAILEQYWSWSIGITLVAMPRDIIFADLAGTIARLKITHIDLTPSLARLVYPEEVPTLCEGVFITGGEALRQEILDSWGPHRVVDNFYGPSETTIGVTVFPRVPSNGRPENIGRQFPNVGTYVFKPGTEEPVLKGGVGELAVTGRLVGKGYLNREELTKEKFPVLNQYGNDRVYRTGDLVRMLHDGCFLFMGRADDQVKLRGQRLEIGEIDQTIRREVSEITNVVTLVVRDERQHKDLLVSFVVVPRSDQSSDQQLLVLDDRESMAIARQVQDACGRRLPRYMVPTYVLTIPRIPLSSNNKVEAKELRKLFNSLDHGRLLSLGVVETGQWTNTARKILQVLQSMKLTDDSDQTGLSPTSSIFSFGIDSISVLRLSMALRRAGFVSVTPALILQHHQLNDLANALETATDKSKEIELSGSTAARQLLRACRHQHEAQVRKVMAVESDEIAYIAPCSPLQEAMITRSRLSLDNRTYFNTFRFALKQDITISRLREAWQRVTAACAILKTRFVQTRDGPLQVARVTEDVPWQELEWLLGDDIEMLLSEKRRLWVAQNQENILRPWELLLLKTNGQHNELVLHIFHGLYDAISLELILSRVIDEYLGLVDVNYGPEFIDGLTHGPLKNYSFSRDFWVQHLESASYSPFPQLSIDPSPIDLSLERTIDFGPLDSVRLALGVTHQSIIQALWLSVIQQVLSNSGVIGIVSSARAIDLEDSERIVGPLFNTLPFYLPISTGETWETLVQKCHQYNIAALPFQHVALRDIQKWTNGGRILFDTIFSLQIPAEGASDDHQLWTRLDSTQDPDFPLAFEATVRPEGRLSLLLVAQASIADIDALSTLLDKFQQAAAHLVQNRHQFIENYPETQPRTQQIVHEATNGYSTHADPSFGWTAMSNAIREQLSLASQIPEHSISEMTSMLELGLDSIDAIRISSRLKAIGISLTTSQLVTGQSISVWMPYLQQPDATEIPSLNGTSKLQRSTEAIRAYLSSTGLDLGNIEAVLPPTPLQDAMVAEMIRSDFCRYFNHDIIKINTDVDISRLKDAWMTVIRNSPILRTSFVNIDSPDIDSAYCQVVWKTAITCIREIQSNEGFDLQQFIFKAKTRACEGAGKSELLQLTFVTTRSQKFCILSIAHALYDGWSLELLHQDIQSAYNQSYTPRESYQSYLGQILESSSEEARHFWTGYLQGASATIIPSTLIKTSSSTSITREEATSSVPLSIVREVCKRQAISLFSIGQACWAAVLASITESLDVTFGVVFSGRDTEASEELLFPTMNTVPVRSVLHGTVQTWLRYTEDSLKGIRQYKHFPLRSAQSLAGVKRKASRLFNSLFILQKHVKHDANTRPSIFSSVGGESAVEYPVCVEMEEADGQIIWRMACDPQFVAQDGVHVLLDRLDMVLYHLIQSPAAEVLNFEGDQVSICSQPSITVTQETHSEPVHQTHDGTSEISAWSRTESVIRMVLSKLSSIPFGSIERRHNIYHLGIDSISAIKASSLLNTRGINLTVTQIVQAESISEMAILADRVSDMNPEMLVDDAEDIIASTMDQLDAVALLQEVGIDISQVEDIQPATPMQVHMLTTWQNSDGEVYYPEFSYTLDGDIQLTRIVSAWKTLIAEMSILRTTFIATKSSSLPFIQVVHRLEHVLKDSSISDRSWDSADQDDANALMLSLQVVLGEDDRLKITVTIHHALYDGISLPIILNRFKRICQAGQDERSSTSDRPWKQLLAYQLSPSTADKRMAFWCHYLQGATTTSFPASSSTYDSGRIKCCRTSYLKQAAIIEITSLQTTASGDGVTLQSLFFAAYSKWLARQVLEIDRSSGIDGIIDDVVFGIYLAHRHLVPGLEVTPYPTLVLVPLRVRQPLERSLIEIAKQILSDITKLSADGYALVGIWEIKQWTGIIVDNFVNFLSPAAELMPSKAKTGEGDSNRPERDISFLEDKQPSDQIRNMNRRKHQTEEPWIKGNLVRDAYPVSPTTIYSQGEC